MGAVVHKLWSQKGPYSRCTRSWNLPQEIRDELALRSQGWFLKRSDSLLLSFLCLVSETKCCIRAGDTIYLKCLMRPLISPSPTKALLNLQG